MEKLVVVLLLMLASCGHQGMREADLSGVYIRSFRTAYAIGQDSLRLEKTEGATYRVTKSTAYRRIIDAKLNGNEEYQKIHWRAIYEPAHKVLNIRPSGKVLGVDVDKQVLTLSKGIYKRIEE